MLKKLKIILKMSFPMKVLKIKNNKVLVQMHGKKTIVFLQHQRLYLNLRTKTGTFRLYINK